MNRSNKLVAGRDILLFFLLCWIAYFTTYLGRLNFTASMAEIIASGDMTKSQAGLVGSGFFFGYGISQLFSGYLGDRLNTRWLVFCGLFGSAAVNLSMGVARGYALMLVLWTLNGILQSFIWSPLMRTMSDLLTGPQCVKACVNFATTTPFGTLGAYGMSALIISLSGWRAVFVIAGALLLGVSLLWLFGERRIEKIALSRGIPPEDPPAPSPAVPGAPTAARSGAVAVLLGAIALSALLHGILKDSIQTWAPTYLLENFHTGSVVSILLTMVLPLVNLSGVYAANYLNRKRFCNETATSALFFLAAALSFVVLALFGRLHIALALAMMAVATSCMLAVNTMLISLAPLQFDRFGKVSTVAGALNAVTSVGSAVSTYGVGAVTENCGWGVTLLMWLAIAVAGTLLCAAVIRPWKRFRRPDGED